MKKVFTKYVHYAGQRYKPGDELPEDAEFEIDEKNWREVGDDDHDDANPVTANYKKMKMEELIALCADRGLSTEGKKADLVERLQDADAALD